MKRIVLIACVVAMLCTSPATVASADRPSSEAFTSSAALSLPVTVRLGDDFARKLQGTPPSFRKAVRVELRRMWKFLDYAKKCRRAPLVTINDFHTGGFVATEMGSYAPCPGGGAWQIFVRQGTTWRTPSALGGHEAATCHDLLRFDVPKFSEVVASCYGADGQLVPYDPAADRAP